MPPHKPAPGLDFATRAQVLAAITPLQAEIAALRMANGVLKNALARAEHKLRRAYRER
jgi:hypothetical protein